MLSAPDPSPPPPSPRRRWLPRLRFSLRSLVSGVLLIGSAGGLWWRWNPWVLIRTVNDPTGFVNDSELTPDGTRLFLQGVGRQSLWDVETGRMLIDAEGGVFAVSSDSARLLMSNSGDYIWASAKEIPPRPPQVVEAESGKPVVELQGQTAAIYMAQFSPNNRQIVTACVDGTAGIWEARTGVLLHTLTGHASNVCFASWSPDGRRIVTGSFDHTARIWDAESGAELQCLTGHTDQVLDAQFFKTGERVWTVSWMDHSCRIWDVNSGQCLSVLSPVEGVKFSPDERIAVTANWKRGTATTFDVATGSVLMTFSEHSGNVDLPRFSPDGTRILTCCTDRTVRVWDVSSGECRTAIQNLGNADIPGAQFSPEGTEVLTWRSSEQARIWNTETGRLLKTFDSGKRSAEFFGARTLLLADANGHLQIWQRRRPEYWWGVAWLPEFWLTVVFAGALGWSVWRDGKRIASPLE